MYSGLWNKSDHVHGLFGLHAVPGTRWDVKHITLLELCFLVIYPASALPFNNKKLTVKFSEGGTTVDIILAISYFFSNEELFYIDKLISENELEIDPKIALVRSFAELILIFPLIFNDIVGYEFAIMPENEKEELFTEGLKLNMEFSSRPAY